MNTLRRALRSGGWASVAVAVALTACDAGGSAQRPPGPASSTRAVKSSTAPMPEASLHYMYAGGADSEGVLISATGATRTGQRAVAYVMTQTGAVFATAHQVFDLVDGGTPVAIGPTSGPSVFLQVDPTLRYVAWEVRRPDGVHARALIYDAGAHRMVLDRVLAWGEPSDRLWVTNFGAAGLRLVHLPGSDSWTFATASDGTLTTPGGQVVDRRTHRVEGPEVSGGVWSPGLRYRATEPRGGRTWHVVDMTTGRDVTPAALLDPELRPAHFAGWLDNETFGVLATSGTWRHPSVAAAGCQIDGGCQVVWRHRLNADDSGLQSSNEIG